MVKRLKRYIGRLTRLELLVILAGIIALITIAIIL